MIFLIAAIAAFLRLYRVEPNLVFHGELGDNYLAIKNFLSLGQIPLLGPATSHPWLSFGPLFYWLFAPFLALFNYNPVSGAYFIAVTQIILIFVNFYFIGKLFSRKTALISSFLIAVSPLFIDLARQSRFFSLVTIFFYPFIYFLTAGNLLLSGLFFGIAINFHLTPIVYVPVIIIYLIKKRTKIKSLVLGILGFVIPNIPFLFYNAIHGFTMLKDFSLWVPYRVAGFVGVVPKNSPTGVTILNNLYTLGGFISASFMYRFLLGAIFVLIVSLFVIWEIKKNWKAKTISNEFLLVLLFLFGYAGIFIHGNPPYHYYLPLYSLPIIFFSLILTKLKSRELIIGILVVMAVLNLRYYFSKSWFYQDTSQIYQNKEVPYPLQLEVVKSIIADSKGVGYSLKRVGDFDYFDRNYAQNYIYLLWWKGNEPASDSKLIYTIYEKPVETGKNEIKIFSSGGVTVTKTQTE